MIEGSALVAVNKKGNKRKARLERGAGKMLAADQEQLSSSRPVPNLLHRVGRKRHRRIQRSVAPKRSSSSLRTNYFHSTLNFNSSYAPVFNSSNLLKSIGLSSNGRTYGSNVFQ
jgi:hypothetical protein